MNNRYTRNRKGFTLVEALVSTVIFCSAAAVIMAISARCMSNAHQDRIYEMAWQLLDRQLAAVSYVGIDEYKKLGVMEGTFTNTDIEYRWSINAEPSTVTDIDEVRMSVLWLEQKKTHSISLDTRMRSTLPTESNSVMSK
jgi:prepilin-type N-terminal cleavage/methylation domain-containing protein